MDGGETEGRRERRTDGFCCVFLVAVCGVRARGTLLLRSAVVVLPIKTYRHNGNVAHIYTLADGGSTVYAFTTRGASSTTDYGYVTREPSPTLQ